MLDNSTLLRLVKAVIVLLLVASGVVFVVLSMLKVYTKRESKALLSLGLLSLSVGYRRTSMIDVASDASLEKFLPSEEPIQVK